MFCSSRLVSLSLSVITMHFCHAWPHTSSYLLYLCLVVTVHLASLVPISVCKMDVWFQRGYGCVVGVIGWLADLLAGVVNEGKTLVQVLNAVLVTDGMVMMLVCSWHGDDVWMDMVKAVTSVEWCSSIWEQEESLFSQRLSTSKPPPYVQILAPLKRFDN